MINQVNYDVKPKSTVVKKGTGFKNKWCLHVQEYAKKHKMTYWKAMTDPECKKSYK